MLSDRGRQRNFEPVSAHARLLPYMDQTPVFNIIDFNVPYDHPNNDRARLTELPVFRCPSDTEKLIGVSGGRNNYFWNAGNGVVMYASGAAGQPAPNGFSTTTSRCGSRDHGRHQQHSCDVREDDR